MRKERRGQHGAAAAAGYDVGGGNGVRWRRRWRGGGGSTVWLRRGGKNDNDDRSRFVAVLEVKWCSFWGKIVLFWILFGCYLGVERSDYGVVATDDDFLVTCGLAVKGIMWLRKWF